MARNVTQDVSFLGFGRSMEKIQVRENLFLSLDEHYGYLKVFPHNNTHTHCHAYKVGTERFVVSYLVVDAAKQMHEFISPVELEHVT